MVGWKIEGCDIFGGIDLLEEVSVGIFLLGIFVVLFLFNIVDGRVLEVWVEGLDLKVNVEYCWGMDDSGWENLMFWEVFVRNDVVVVMLIVLLILEKWGWFCEVDGYVWLDLWEDEIDWVVCDMVVVMLSLEGNDVLSERVDGVEIVISLLDWRFEVFLEEMFFFGRIWLLLNGIFFRGILLSFFKMFFFFCCSWVVFFVVVCVVFNVFWNLDVFIVLMEVIFFSDDDLSVLDNRGDFFFDVFFGVLVWGVVL